MTLAAALLGGTPLAQGTLVTWTLQNVVLDDGGTATGSFTVDTSIFPNQFSQADVTTTPPGHHYNEVAFGRDPASVAAGISGLSFYISGNLHTPVFSFSVPLDITTALAGTYPILVTDSGEADWPFFTVPRHVAGGTISAVPEPSALALLVIGFSLSGYYRRKTVFAATSLRPFALGLTVLQSSV
jgi:hypothetical protein